jgi:hypothetical protein
MIWSHPLIALSGVRSSCERVARNSSLSRSASSALRSALPARRHRILQSDADRVGQAAVVRRRLDDVVGESGAQACGRDLLAARVREHHHRQIQAAGAHVGQHLQAVGPSQLVVGDDDVGVAPLERRDEFGLIDDFVDRRVRELREERPPRQEPILGTVVDEQDARGRHPPPPFSRGRSLSSSQ